MTMDFNRQFMFFQYMFIFVFVIVLCIILFAIIRAIRQWHENNNSPVLTVDARLVSRRENVTHHHSSSNASGGYHSSTSTTYYATFEVESGDRMEFTIDAQEYGMLAEGDQGRLTFQGTRYLSFDRNRTPEA